ncbi:hypothetical protein FSP39_014621 [Pinctada imbricata]|uniref:Uncharacterized protein n=1 Tax=Pinctada imbricata TaxID=66713 RepID=A0AA89C2H7_PINIB|nr:hypothetical protein FSP39_014621 [Pinctada imbricata]
MAFYRDEGKLRSDDVRWALESFNRGIKEYFDDTFRQFHADLYQNIIQIRGICCQKCSKKKQVADWCSLCSKWRDAILAKHRFGNTMMGTFNWKNIDSTKWPSDVEEVQKVFLPSWYKGKLDTTDLSSCLSIMANCTLFNNRKKLLAIRDIRNHVSHGGMSITVTEKQEYIGKILSFLKKDNLKTFPSVRKAIKHVTLLETQSIKDLYENDLIEEIERNKIEERLNARRGIYCYVNTCATSSILMSLLIVLMACLIFQWNRNNVSEGTTCL